MGVFGVSYHTIISLFSGNTRFKESDSNVCTLSKIAPFINQTNFRKQIAFNVYPTVYYRPQAVIAMRL